MASKKKTGRAKRYTAHPARDPKRRMQTVKRVLISLAILLVVVLTVMFLVLSNNSQISVGENALGSLLSPVQNAFSSATRGVQNFLTNWRNYDKLQDEYDSLSRENQQLSLQLSSAEEALIENERLKSLLDAQNAYESLDPIYAKVIARDAGQWFCTFSINRGSAHGISKDMAVVDGNGLIGHVYEVGLNYAKVLSIIDPRSGVGCLVQRTRDNGVLRGAVSDSDDAAVCSIYYLPNINNIVPGDVIVTSGTDGLYPKGLPVGTVTQISLSAGSEGNYASVVPYVDFLHIEEVLVLRDVVEKATGSDAATLLTPSPAPTATPAPTQDNAQPTVNPSSTEDTWEWPTTQKDDDTSGNPLESLPEDSWVEN